MSLSGYRLSDPTRSLNSFDIIDEYTGNAGVTVDSVLVKDTNVTLTLPLLTDSIGGYNAASGVTADSFLMKAGKFAGTMGNGTTGKILMATTQALTGGVQAKLLFDTSELDPLGTMVDTVNNKLTIPTTGIYLLQIRGYRAGAGAPGHTQLWIGDVTPTNYYAYCAHAYDNSSTAEGVTEATNVLALSAGTDLYGYMQTVANATAGGTTLYTECWMSATMLCDTTVLS